MGLLQVYPSRLLAQLQDLLVLLSLLRGLLLMQGTLVLQQAPQQASIQGKQPPQTHGAALYAATRASLPNARMRSGFLTVVGCSRTKLGPTTMQNSKVCLHTASSASALVVPRMQCWKGPGGVTSANKFGSCNKQSTPPEPDAVQMKRPSKESTTPPWCNGWQHTDMWIANMRRQVGPFKRPWSISSCNAFDKLSQCALTKSNSSAMVGKGKGKGIPDADGSLPKGSASSACSRSSQTATTQ